MYEVRSISYLPCYSFLDCIVIGKSSPTQKFFKVSEEKVITGSQVWTVGRMVKLYEAIFPYITSASDFGNWSLLMEG